MKSGSHRSRTRASRSRGFYLLLVAACIGGLIIWKNANRKSLSIPAPTQASASAEAAIVSANDAALISSLVADEETCLALSPRMTALSQDLLNLRIPGPAANGVFAPTVVVSDLESAPKIDLAGPDTMQTGKWRVAEDTHELTKVDLWRPLLNAVDWFEHAKIFIVAGEHPGADMYQFDSKAVFDALARMKSGEWRSFHGKLNLHWARSKNADGKPGDWQITRWTTEEMQWVASPKRLFVESLDSAMRTPGEAAKLRHSLHYQATVQHYRDGMKKLPHPYFAPISVNQKEGIAIADINGDGFDDIYITVRLGKNLLLRNNGDGTFTEDAESFGLALPGHTTCALLADFDNDGDLDAMLGRSLLKTTYLENREGKFFQYPIPNHMPMAVISMAAADYNSDGLLDVYLCTYRPAAPAGASPAGGVAQVNEGDFDWPDEFFSPETAREYRRRIADHKRRIGGTVLDQLGPPNMLLINRGGGRFDPAPENSTVGVWRNSLQATWGDYNEDGRPDLYIANDWGLDNLFRNDGPAGFTDVASQAGLTSYGFAMGASWGDYDNDGREDLYVSNMYSEAGRRITARIPGLDKMFLESAAGNWLYHKQPDGTFKQVAGLQPPAMTVMNAGWSWGGCFADFDNDRFLDLYVINGYFTAPKELSSGLDIESNLWRTMVRTDENLARPSFRFSPEWRRTPAPDHLGPQIDARLAGVERVGDRVLVHSLNGNERNRYFANRAGRSFADLSSISGLDNIADSRGFAVLDYDRDGWQDIALVNANQPLFNLYRNEMAAAGSNGGIIAIRFVGGSRSSAPSKGFASRDGYGARVTVDLGDQKIVREHRCGDGWAIQNSPTMIIGVGAQEVIPSLTVKWPSGKTSSTKDIPEGALIIVYENPTDAPNGESFTRSEYRVPQVPQTNSTADSPMFALATIDNRARPGTRVRVYTTFTTSSAAFRQSLPLQQFLKDELADVLDLIAIPIDPLDDNAKLAAYNNEFRPPVRLINLAPADRKEAAAAFAKTLGHEASLPVSVITDGSGRFLEAQAGVPSLSTLRRLMNPTF